jgi:hypothetical protein
VPYTITSHSAPVYTNCTFANNTGLINGAGLYNNFYTNTVVNNSIFWGNTGIQVFNNASTLSINNAIIEGGCPAGYDCTNVSDQDPQFLDAAANNFQLSLTSPAIGTGNSAANNTVTDLAGNPRTSTGGALDLGAHCKISGLLMSTTMLPAATMVLHGRMPSTIYRMHWPTLPVNR